MKRELLTRDRRVCRCGLPSIEIIVRSGLSSLILSLTSELFCLFTRTTVDPSAFAYGCDQKEGTIATPAYRDAEPVQRTLLGSSMCIPLNFGSSEMRMITERLDKSES